METGCAAQECWYQNNSDRIGEFNGLKRVIVNDAGAAEEFEFSYPVCDEDEIQLCDVCLDNMPEIIGRCKLCNRWMFGLCHFPVKGMCVDCVD